MSLAGIRVGVPRSSRHPADSSPPPGVDGVSQHPLGEAVDSRAEPSPSSSHSEGQVEEEGVPSPSAEE